ncbi:retinol dehydrogenase 14 [Phyllostomus discolor]|uniref:Retinol dehydrogenase 14 n=1 Tax=Phyllostomus discolor TaxID=89673 RepID=A0A834E351_9CHIR|nr:retinol dehydrogenase 14 [Phyllostomus discolor]
MSQTSLKQKKKNESGTKYSRESLESEKRRESDKSGARVRTQGSQELSLPKTDSRGYLVRNQWSGTSRSPSVRAPSVEEPRSKSASLKVPTSSTSSQVSSTSQSQQESTQELSLQASPPTPPVAHTPPVFLDPPSPPTTPDSQSQTQSQPQSQFQSRRSTKMQESHEAWTHGVVRDFRDTRDSRDSRDLREFRDMRDARDMQQREYPRTPPSEWKSYGQRRTTYSSQPDRDFAPDLSRQREEDNDDEEAYWSSVKTLYEKTPGCSRPRPPKPKHAITIAVSSQALFNMMDGKKIYEEEGLEKYMEYQVTNENVILTPGPAFRFIKALQHVNTRLHDLYPDEQDLFDIVLMTNNHAQVGVRLINSVNHYGLLIDRFCLTGGKSPVGYLKSYLTNLYLSSDAEKVQEAIKEGIAAATMFDGAKDISYCETQLRVAFDGDSVLFCEESEHITKDRGLDKYFQHDPVFDNKSLAQVSQSTPMMSNKKRTSTEHRQRYYKKKADNEEKTIITDEEFSWQILAKV